MPDYPIISEEAMRRKLEPPTGPVRLILDTDAFNEIDDQFTIAWALLSQDQLRIEGMLAEPYSHRHHRDPLTQAYNLMKADPDADLSDFLRKYQRSVVNMIANDMNPHDLVFADPDEGMELSYQEILKVYDLLDEDPTGKVYRGSPDYLKSLAEPIRSPAAEFLVERALADEDSLLYVAAIGCVTNIASAILMAPEIIDRIVVLWTSSYPSAVTYLSNIVSLNLMQDKIASQVLFDCGVPHVYLPGFYIGEQLKLSLPDVERWVRGKGKIGDYLYHLYTHNPIYPMQGINEHFGRTWVIWDLIDIAWLLNPAWVPSRLTHSPVLTDDLYYKQDSGRHIMREAFAVDRDAIFRDLFSKLAVAP